MDGPESSAVLEEVEALFKKLQHLPDSIRQKALNCIQGKLPDALPSKDDDGVEPEETKPSPKTIQSPKTVQSPKAVQSLKTISSPRKDAVSPKSSLPAKVTQSSIILRGRPKSGSISVKSQKNQQISMDDSINQSDVKSEQESKSSEPEVKPVIKRSSLRQANIIKPIFKITPRKSSVKISSVTPKAKKMTNPNEGTSASNKSKDSIDVNPSSPRKKALDPKELEAPTTSEEVAEAKDEIDAEGVVPLTKLEGVSSKSEDNDSALEDNSPELEENNLKPEGRSPKSDSVSPSETRERAKKPFMGPKSAKLAKKIRGQKIELDENYEEDEAYEVESLTPSKDSSAKDTPKFVAFDDGGPEFVLEDVRTLKGRKTKRINLASLSGFRKPRVKVSAAPKPTSNTKNENSNSLSPAKQRGAPQRAKGEVPSEVAESAEILASLSSGIPHNEGLSQVDCLKDKTNNQQTVITYEFETMVGEEDASKESGEHLPQTKEEFVDIAENSVVENVDSDVERDPLEDAEKNAAGEYSCSFCDFKCTSRQSLSAHVRKHKENIPKPGHVCPECNKRFSQSCSLQLHLKRHRGERDFHCGDCDYKAFTKVDLSRHQTIHTGERNKICEYCGKTFAKDSTLRDHVKSVHERKVKHTCEMCGFVTHRANNLRVHIRMRHHGEYNNHVCPVCKASVKQKNAFLEHMRSHTGERPFKCESCTAAFACLARLNVHRNAVHGERQFKCEDCEKSFQTKHHLLRHRAIHTKERPYACPYCSYACNTQGNIAKHVRSIHNLPNFSYRKHKDLVENGGQPREIDPEWIRKGEEVTEEYLNELSKKMGRTITLDELWSKQEENRRRKEEQDKTRQEAKERRALKNEAAGVAYLEKVKKRRLEKQQTGESPKKLKKRPVQENIEDIDGDIECIEETEEVPLYKLVSQGGNIRLCLETDEVQVYTGDATRDVSFLQVKDGELTDSEEIQTIQGYMNEEGQFVRIEDGVMVDEDSSTVVVIIDSEMQDEINPEVSEVMEVTCEEDYSGNETEGLSLNVVSSSKGETKPSVLRIIKQEI